MPDKAVQIAGVAWTLLFAALVVWVYAVAPRDFREVTTSASVAVGAYAVDRERFDRALELFRQEDFRAARDEWARADPAQRDARTQFYTAYAFYREGWGRLYNDDALFREGLAAADRSRELAPDFTADDPDLKIKTAVELKTELARGLETSLGDFNPLKVARERQ